MRIALLLVLVVLSKTIYIEINNIHNGFKYVLQGKASPASDSIIIPKTNIIEDTISGTIDLSDFFTLSGKEATVKLADLTPVTEMDELFTTLTVATWNKNTEITVGFLFSDDNYEQEDQEALYELLRTKTSAMSEEF